jgi:hypothetical protein
LANQESEKTTPKVSKLPLPISDSPLVIDLPDGQKIVVGKMTQGSVIEVATWRGVGRPDSRTSRLMLGMGNGNVNDDSDDENSQQPGPARPPVSRKPAGFAGFVFTLKNFVTNFNHINWSATFRALIASLNSKKPKKSKAESTDQVRSEAPAITPTPTVSPVSDDAEIEAWLNKITENASRTAKKGAKPAAKKTPAKRTAVTKKAAPKSAKKR